MSLCDSCPKPGECCRNIHLYYADGAEVTTWADDPLGVQRVLAERALPFVPSSVEIYVSPPDSEEPGREYCTWVFQCPKLGADGRCTDYENRPELCRHLEPGASEPCVLYDGGKA